MVFLDTGHLGAKKVVKEVGCGRQTALQSKTSRKPFKLLSVSGASQMWFSRTPGASNAFGNRPIRFLSDRRRSLALVKGELGKKQQQGGQCPSSMLLGKSKVMDGWLFLPRRWRCWETVLSRESSEFSPFWRFVFSESFRSFWRKIFRAGVWPSKFFLLPSRL